MSEESVTRWMDELRTGDRDAAEKIVNRYFGQIVRLVRSRLPSHVCRAADEEDVALSALHRVVGGIEEGEFDKLACRDELWKLLVAISRRKASSHIVRETAAKRGGGKLRGESALAHPQDNDAVAGLDGVAGPGPTPAEALELKEYADQIIQFLAGLSDQTLCDIAIWKSLDRTDAWIAEQLDCSTRTIERKRQLIREKVLQWAETPK